MPRALIRAIVAKNAWIFTADILKGRKERKKEGSKKGSKEVSAHTSSLLDSENQFFPTLYDRQIRRICKKYLRQLNGVSGSHPVVQTSQNNKG